MSEQAENLPCVNETTESILKNPAVVDESVLRQVEEFRQKGNEEFGKQHFAAALDFYTKAIDMKEENRINDNLHLLYCNRSFCHIKIENFGKTKTNQLWFKVNGLDDYFMKNAITNSTLWRFSIRIHIGNYE
eukprot:GHVL01000540.1.p3 GENE.GHVL01000540.1~~GHVL01000540.1.p3  ORF type:complete len:132 (+),score=19.42 GHVL01000540.1:988-1383(+)